MGINFPPSPVVGDLYPVPPVAGVPQYKWDGTVWVANVEQPLTYVKRTGDTMTGILALSGDPVAALDAVPKQWAAPFDAMAYSGMQINGSMEVSQELGETGTTVPGKYFCDGWGMTRNGTMVTIASTTTAAFGVFSGLPSVALCQATTAQASLGAGDFSFIFQPIEGYRMSRLGWGAAGAKPITIAFWSMHDPAGQYSVTVRNGTSNRHYATSYTHAVANVPQYNVITIPGDTAGTWTISNTVGMTILFAQACGSTYIAPTANAWIAGGPYFAVSGQVNGVAAVNKLLRITGVVVLPGIYAPSAAQSPLIMRPYGQELVMCQRYLYSWKGGGTGFANGTTIVQLSQLHPVAMRTNPAMVGVAGVLATIDTTTASNINPSSNSISLLSVTPQALEFRINNYVGLSTGQVCAVQPQAGIIANVDARL